MIISSFFLKGGKPALGLKPTIRIWEIVSGTPGDQILVVTDELVTEVGDGFYKYNFVNYDPTKNYDIRVDGGVTLSGGERYNIAATEEMRIDSSSVSKITDSIWNEPAGDHLQTDTMGYIQSTSFADVQQLRLDTAHISSVVETLLKYESCRTKIDKVDKTLTVYDTDGVTVIKVFDLKNSVGAPSVDEVCERVPKL